LREHQWRPCGERQPAGARRALGAGIHLPDAQADGLMDREGLLRAFDAQMRADPPPEAGVERARAEGGLRTTGAYKFIGGWRLTEGEAAAAARREAAHFRELGGEVEWKVFSHDGPPGLEAALADAGWVADEPETLLAFDLDSGTLPLAPPS